MLTWEMGERRSEGGLAVSTGVFQVVGCDLQTNTAVLFLRMDASTKHKYTVLQICENA